jgi:hypothetical protein
MLTPWQLVQYDVLWQRVHRLGELRPGPVCELLQPDGCGICRPWQRMQLFWPWHFSHFALLFWANDPWFER